MSDRIVACPSCDCKIRIVLDGSAAKWGCGNCKQHFELIGDVPILVATAAPALPPPRRVTNAPTDSPNRFPPPKERANSGGGKVVIYSIAGFCAFMLAFVGAFFLVKTLLGGSRKARKPVVVARNVPEYREIENYGDRVLEASVDSASESHGAPPPGFHLEDVEVSDESVRAVPTHSSKQVGPPRWTMPQDVDGILAEFAVADENQKQKMMIRLANHPVKRERAQEVIRTVKPHLTSSNQTLRQFTEMTVLKWGGESDRELFWQIARSDSNEFSNALSRLQELDDPGVFKQLIKNLREPKKAKASFRLLNNIGPEAEEMVVKAFKASKNEHLRTHAIQYLARYGTEKSLPFLKALMDDETAKYPITPQARYQIRLAIARAAHQTKSLPGDPFDMTGMPPGLADAIRKEHRRDPTKFQSKKRGRTPTGGLPIGAPPGMTELLTEAENPTPPPAKDLDGMLSQLSTGHHVSNHLSRLSGGSVRKVTDQQRDKIIATVTPFIEKGEKRNLRAASRVVCRLGEKRHREVFWKIVRSGDVTIVQALEKLLDLDDPDVIPHLTKMLSDKQRGGTALTILIKAGPEAEQPLIDAFESIDDVGVKVNATKFFYHHGTEKSVPLLTKLAEDKNPFIGPLAKQSLEKIESRKK